MKENTLINDLSRGNLARQLVSFAIPFAAANLLQTLYTMADLVIVGQFVGSTGLSAVSVSGQLTILLYALGIGFSNGGQILISQLVGRKDYSSLKSTIGTSVTAQFIISVIIAVLGIIFTKPMLAILNTPPEAMPQAVDYLIICCCGIPFVYTYNAFASVLRGMGDSKRPFYFIFTSAMTNIVLDLLFVGAFKMESAGAALATSLSQFASCVFAFTYLYKRRETLGFDFKLSSFAIDWGKLKTIVSLSLPLALMTAAINISMMFVTSLVNVYGLVASAVSGVGSKLNSIMSIVTQAIQTSTATIVGQNMGAGKHDRVKKTVYIGWVICLAFALVVCALSLLFPRQIFSIFSSEPDVLDLSVSYLRIAVWLFISFALMSPPLGMINGVG
ncbi:MAG: MATE family efflux transporter, partial [Oscillospiraceae bacterium]